MAFVLANFQPCAGGPRRGTAPAIHSYQTTDAAATVDTADYFLQVKEMLAIGDLIYRVTLSSGALSTAGFHVVKDLTATSVDVTDTLALTVTDTD